MSEIGATHQQSILLLRIETTELLPLSDAVTDLVVEALELLLLRAQTRLALTALGVRLLL